MHLNVFELGVTGQMITESGHTGSVKKGFMALRRCLALVCVLTMALGGCVIPRHRGVVVEPFPISASMSVTPHFPVGAYKLTEGDTLEFIYLTRPQKTATSYRLQVKDQIDVEFTYHPELNRTLRIRPDGKISIPRKTDVVVAGLTPDQASAMLRDTYSNLLKDPEITVTVREFNAKLDELQKAIATAPYGQARVSSIRPDGGLSLPYIPDVQAAGLSVPELTAKVNKQYADLISDMTVSVLLKDVVGNLVFVDGEVDKPGVFTMKGPMTVQAALALAGGTKNTAEPRTVLVMTKGNDGTIIPRTIDLTAMTGATDYTLQKNDLIYVPKSLIARADVWVDQNIRQLIMFQGWSLGLSTQLGRQTSR